jgi:hypothetical protein
MFFGGFERKCMTMILKIIALTHARAQVLTSSPSLRERTEVRVKLQYVIARNLHSSNDAI